MKHAAADRCPGPAVCVECAPLRKAKLEWKPDPQRIEKTMARFEPDGGEK